MELRGGLYHLGGKSNQSDDTKEILGVYANKNDIEGKYMREGGGKGILRGRGPLLAPKITTTEGVNSNHYDP